MYGETRVAVMTTRMNYSSRNIFKTNPWPTAIVSPGEGIPFWDSTCTMTRPCGRGGRWRNYHELQKHIFANLRKTLQGQSIHVFLFREKYNAAVFKEVHFCVCCVADKQKWAVLEELYQLSGFPGSCTTVESFR